MASKEFQSFKAIPLIVSKDTSTSHELFIKEHSLRLQEANKPPGRTLFVLNIPPYIHTNHLKHLFKHCGKVLNVLIAESSTGCGFKTAYVIFAQREGLLKALQVTSLKLDESVPLKTGLDLWMEEYNQSIIDAAKLSKEINQFMLNYDKSEEKEKKDASKSVDDEGWTVVTKKGHRPGLANKESVQLKLSEKIHKKSKKKELKNFYTFQIKESKMKNLALLRKNYEDAKKKVNEMKSSRRFKPY